MWLFKWLKPATKIGTVVQEVTVDEKTLLNRLLALNESVGIDSIYTDIVLRRFLLTLHWGDVNSLFNALIDKRKDTPTQVAVSVHSYFKAAGCSPSVCLERLAVYLGNTERVPYSVSEDIERLIIQLTEIQNISKPKD